MEAPAEPPARGTSKGSTRRLPELGRRRSNGLTMSPLGAPTVTGGSGPTASSWHNWTMPGWQSLKRRPELLGLDAFADGECIQRVVAPVAARFRWTERRRDQAARAEAAAERSQEAGRDKQRRGRRRFRGSLRPSALSARQRRPAGRMGARAGGDGSETDSEAGLGGSGRRRERTVAASNASAASDREPIVDSVVAAAAPAETDNLLLSPITGQPRRARSGPLASNDPSARRAHDVVKAVADSPVGAETIYGEGDATKVADLVDLGPASAASEDGGEQPSTSSQNRPL